VHGILTFIKRLTGLCLQPLHLSFVAWEFKLQMVHLLAKGTHNMSQISRDYHVTRSLLYAWIRLYQERGEAAFVPDRATASPPESERPRNAGKTAPSLSLTRAHFCDNI
jgi:transposase-like protein